MLPVTHQCLAETSQDAYITGNGATWTIGSAAVEMTVALRNGKLVTTGFKNKANGHDLSPFDATGPWMLVDAKTSKLKQGELQLDLTLRRDSLAVTKTYVVYPGSSIIREWTEFKNVGFRPSQALRSGISKHQRPAGRPSVAGFRLDDRRQQCPWFLGSQKRKSLI